MNTAQREELVALKRTAQGVRVRSEAAVAASRLAERRTWGTLQAVIALAGPDAGHCYTVRLEHAKARQKLNRAEVADSICSYRVTRAVNSVNDALRGDGDCAEDLEWARHSLEHAEEQALAVEDLAQGIGEHEAAAADVAVALRSQVVSCAH
jgi:hypothetical protein